jgi:hypothetical protein
VVGLVGKRLWGAKILVLPDEPFATGGNCIYFWRDSLQIPTADFENTGGRSIQLFQIDDPSHAQKQRLSRSTKMVSRFRTARSAARMRVDFREMSSIHFSPEALARALTRSMDHYPPLSFAGVAYANAASKNLHGRGRPMPQKPFVARRSPAMARHGERSHERRSCVGLELC